jgi:uncharacterized protein (DUF885 family)
VTQLSGPQDVEDYLARLDAYGAAVDQVIATIEHDRALATGLGEKAREAGLDAPGDWATRAADKVREVVIRAFRDEVLRDGGAPLQLLEARITRWLESQQ